MQWKFLSSDYMLFGIGTSSSHSYPVAFTANRSVQLSLVNMNGVLDWDSLTSSLVVATKTGSLIFSSNYYEFELENPYDNQNIKAVCVSRVCGIVVTLSQQYLQVWDIFRDVDGMRVNPVHTVLTTSSAKSLYLNRTDDTCFVGLENGKVVTLTIGICANAVPLPRYAVAPYADVGSCVTSIAGVSGKWLLFGTDSGTVRVVHYQTQKLIEKVKGPKSASMVSRICVIPSSASSPAEAPPSFVVCYDTCSISVVSRGSSVVCTVDLPSPANYVFAVSTSSDVSPLLVQTSDNQLLRLVGPKWSHSTNMLEEAKCLALFPGNETSAILSLEQDGLTTTLRQYEIESGLGPLKSTRPSCAVGSLTLGSLGRQPVASISLPRTEASLEPNLIRLCNFLREITPDSTNRFVFDYNAGLWEGMVASIFNGPSEVAFTIYTQTSALVVGRVPIACPSMSVLSSSSISILGPDKWSIVLGFSSGQVGVVDSFLDFPNPQFRWKPMRLLESAESVHSGAKITSVDRSMMDGNIVVSLDENGMVCFSRLDTESVTPAHVVIAGEGGSCFPNPANNTCYICMSDGIVEAVKVPRIKRDGSEDIYDSSVWDATTITAESLPLEGRFVAAFPQDGVAVRETGIVLMNFPSKGVSKISKIIISDSKIRCAEIKTVEGRKFVVVLTDQGVAAYDAADGFCVFQRPLQTIAGATLLKTMHVFEFGVALTPLLFADRSKALSATDTIIRAAQKRLKYPVIRSTPLLVEESIKKEGTHESGKSGGSEKKGFFKKIFKSSKHEEEKFKPTDAHIREARDQLAKNLEKMAKLQDDADEMQNASADFLKLATNLNNSFRGGPTKEKKKKFGIF